MAFTSHHRDSGQKLPKDVVSLAHLPWPRILVSVLGMLLAMLMAALDQTIVATALPRVVADLGGFDQFAWVFTAYMLASTTSIPIMGKLSDIYGRKWVLAGGVALFLIGSALCGSAQDMTQLILFRGIQGLGAGSIIANSYAVVGDIFPPAQRGQWTGVVGAVFALAIILGPLAGGYITDHLTWRWIFFVNLPIGALTLLVILFGMVNVRHPQISPGVDYRGAFALGATVVPLLLALTLAGDKYAWSSPQVVGMLSFSALMGLLFFMAERSASEPLIPGFLFKNPIFTAAMIVTFLTAIGMFGAIMFIPLFVQGVNGSSATNAGLTLMPMMLSGVMAAVVAGHVISRTGKYRLVAIGGVSAMVLGAYLLTLLGSNSSSTDAIWYTVIAGAGLGATLPAFMISVQNAFPDYYLGVVSAAIQFFRNIGGAVGTAVLAAFMTIRLGDWLSRSVPPDSVSALPPDVSAKLGDPQALLNPSALVRIEELASQGEGGTEALQTAVEGLRAALASAMHDVFLLGFGITLLALATTLLLFKEIPLRKTMAEPEAEPRHSSPD